MIKKSDYLFYRAYSLQLMIGKKENAALRSVLTIVVLFSSCFTAIVNILYFLAERKVDATTYYQVPLIFSLGLMFFMSFFYLFRKRYKTIIEKYKDEPESKAKKLNMLLLAVFLISFFLSMFSFLLVN